MILNPDVHLPSTTQEVGRNYTTRGITYAEPRTVRGFFPDNIGSWGLPLKPPLQRYFVLLEFLCYSPGSSGQRTTTTWQDYTTVPRFYTVDASCPKTAIRKALRDAVKGGKPDGYASGPMYRGHLTYRRVLALQRVLGRLLVFEQAVRVIRNGTL